MFISVVLAVFVVLYLFLSKLEKAYRMRVVTCVIRPEQLGDVAAALRSQNMLLGMTVLNVRGFGRQMADVESSLQVKEQVIQFRPKLKLELLVRNHDVDRVIQIVTEALRTGQVGDGKVLVFEAVTAMRIRTGERGISAL